MPLIKPVIMIVDDQAVIRSMVVSTLKNTYRVLPFESGLDALDFLKNHTVDLILLDYEMPVMNGYEVLKELKTNERTRDLPVLFLTAATEHTMELRMLESGATDLIPKPFEPAMLLVRLKLHLELSQYRKQTIQVQDKMYHAKRDTFLFQTLTRAVELRDHGTEGHISRLRAYVRIIAQELLNHAKPGYERNAQQISDLVETATLHDIGMAAIPNHIMHKPARLTPEDFAIIKTHPTQGARLLDEFSISEPFFETAREIVLYHHEKWNGEGYPHQLKGEAIPLSARIVALADAYDTITSDRPYKAALNHDQAIKIIQVESGMHFDPYLVEILLRCQKAFAEVFNKTPHY